MNRWHARTRQSSGTMIIAHRGASAYAPENTLQAFLRAAELGAHAIELDVQISRDGQLVVCHDADVSRTTNGSGAIHDLDLATLQTLDAGYHFAHESDGTPFRDQGLRIPTLTAVFGAIPRSVLVNVELKATLVRPSDPALRHRVVQILASWLDDSANQGYHERILLSSFDWLLVDAVRNAGLGLSTAYLIGPQVSLGDGLSAAANAGHAAIHPHESLVTATSQPALAMANALGIAVNVWTVDDSERMRDLVDLGVNGIVTNRPDRLAEIIRE